jgi:putative N6-adenine-specific DNA methylase
MCGSGTIPIEAAWLATRTPPQIKRASFGFFKWPNFDETLWNEVKQAADDQIRPCPVKIYASDIDQRARNATAINLMGSGMENNIRLQSVAFDKLLRPSNNGVLITNPPYDERMRVDEITTFYKAIGDRFKKQWMGWDAWLISSNRAALKQVGLRTSRRLALFNGALECSFHKYEMYEGTKNIDPNQESISE